MRKPATREGQAGPIGATGGPSYWRGRVMPAEGRGLSSRIVVKEVRQRRRV